MSCNRVLATLKHADTIIQDHQVHNVSVCVCDAFIHKNNLIVVYNVSYSDIDCICAYIVLYDMVTFDQINTMSLDHNHNNFHICHNSLYIIVCIRTCITIYDINTFERYHSFTTCLHPSNQVKHIEANPYNDNLYLTASTTFCVYNIQNIYINLSPSFGLQIRSSIYDLYTTRRVLLQFQMMQMVVLS